MCQNVKHVSFFFLISQENDYIAVELTIAASNINQKMQTDGLYYANGINAVAA